ncbi:MAG: hypothetical protein H7175_02380 [Burkholderiales bacterium]|nr:hypothetical protein [Anaerolineae bacterium]
MQRQMAQQNLMMQQMMTRMMEQQSGQGGQAAGSAPEAASPATREQVQAMLDNLDMKLANGQLSEDAYNKLVTKWQARLDAM